MDVRDLPALNATLNAIATVLLVVGYRFIRAGRREAHRKTMLAAFAVSVLFLTSYLVYHAQVGSVPFQKQGVIRTVLLRTVWGYQRHAELEDERLRLRALLLHSTAAALAYDYQSLRKFMRSFVGACLQAISPNADSQRSESPASRLLQRAAATFATIDNAYYLETAVAGSGTWLVVRR